MSERLKQALAYADFIVPIADRDPSPSLAEAFEAGWKASRAQPAQAVPLLSEREVVKCLTASGCVGTVKMSYDSGPYEITRTSVNADRFARAIEQAVRSKLGAGVGWQPIETAPRGSGQDGPSNVNDPAYIAPPDLLLWTREGMRVGCYEWYFHPGYGRGASPDEPAWRDADGGPLYGSTHWMPLPPPPGIVGKEGA